MLCEARNWDNLIYSWFFFLPTAGFALLFVAISLFAWYYWNPTYEQWCYKSNPKFPPPEMIRFEVKQMLKGLGVSVICPSVGMWMTANNYNQGYCGMGKFGWEWDIIQFVIIWVCSDFFEFLYHWTGHKYDAGWENHRHHHKFFNPTPFATIADEFTDQFFRALPLAAIPILMPTNMDILFFQYALFFGTYGTYLHWGYESDYLPDDHWLCNTSFQHYLHHAKSIKNRPYHCGFFFKIWDQLFGSVYDHKDHAHPCLSARQEREMGLRTLEAWNKIEKPDYSSLLQLHFWLEMFSSGDPDDLAALKKGKAQ